MTSYSTVQKQQLSQLGAYLQEKRQEQGKSLEDISLQTYIRAQLLKAVETGDTSDLPQPIFVQGFIRRYADALGLDGSNFAKQFPVHSIPNTPRPVPRPAAQVDMSYQTAAQKPPVQAKPNQIKSNQPEPTVGAMPIKSEPEPVLKRVGTPEKAIPAKEAPEKAAEKPVSLASKDLTLDPTPVSDSERKALGLNGNGVGAKTTNSYQSTPFTKDETTASLDNGDDSSPVGAMPAEAFSSSNSSISSGSDTGVNWLPLGIGAAVFVGAIALIGPRIMGGGGSTEQPTEPPVEEATTPQPEVVQTAPPPEVESEPEPVSNTPVNVQVEITEAGPSWMSVNVDGEIVFEGLLDPGTQQLWEGQESITMNVGNAGAALISANGSEPTPAGNPGGAEFLTFTAEE